MKPNNKKVAVVGSALAGAVALTLFGSASPALAYLSGGLSLQVAVQSPAMLVARGAAIDVPVRIQCSGTKSAGVQVSVTQRVGSGIASGSGYTDAGCGNGSSQTILIHVAASPGKAFTQGMADASAHISGCNPAWTTCGDEATNALVKIEK